MLGGFMPREPEPPPVQRDEGMADSLRRVEMIGRVILSNLTKLERKMADNHATLEQVLTAVAAQKTVIQSMATFLEGLKARLNQALAGELSPSAQAKLDDALSEIQGNTRSLTNAVLNNDDDPTNDVNDDGSPKGPPETMKIATTTNISSSKTVASLGETISLSAGVSSDGGSDKPFTGTVTFASEAGEIGKAGLDSTGVAAMSIADLPAGDHSLTATYGGDVVYASSTSQTLTQTVMPADTGGSTAGASQQSDVNQQVQNNAGQQSVDQHGAS